MPGAWRMLLTHAAQPCQVHGACSSPMLPSSLLVPPVGSTGAFPACSRGFSTGYSIAILARGLPGTGALAPLLLLMLLLTGALVLRLLLLLLERGAETKRRSLLPLHAGHGCLW